MSVGIFTLIAVKEQTYSALKILLVYTIIGIILCFFGMLTSINVVQRYQEDPIKSQKDERNKEEGIQFALAGLLIGLFTFAFLFLSCLSCMLCWTIPKFCHRYPGNNPQRHPIYQQRAGPQNFPRQSQLSSRRIYNYFL